MPENNEYSTAYRPRYSEEESSDAAFKKDERHRRCMGRKKRAMTILLLSAFFIGVGIVTRVYFFFVGLRGRLTGNIQMLTHDDLLRNESSTSWGSWKRRVIPVTIDSKRAQFDSDGFFIGIPDDQWKEIKGETKRIIDDQDDTIMRTSYLLTEGGANINSHVWWVDNWKINFTCQNKVHIGGNWICDPARIMSVANEKADNKKWGWQKKNKFAKKECIVYISGGNEMEFGHQFLDYSLARMVESHDFGEIGIDSLACEVHVFAPNVQEIPEERHGLFIHNWGFRPGNKMSMGLAADNSTAIAFKTLEETIDELQHAGRISMLIVDCEGCEWDFYTDIISLEEPIHQVILQMHGTPYMANELFLAMQEEGYVIFHREAEHTGKGEVWDYSWLKLPPQFFNWKEV